jgi:hypothetical protein
MVVLLSDDAVGAGGGDAKRAAIDLMWVRNGAYACQITVATRKEPRLIELSVTLGSSLRSKYGQSSDQILGFEEAERIGKQQFHTINDWLKKASPPEAVSYCKSVGRKLLADFFGDMPPFPPREQAIPFAFELTEARALLDVCSRNLSDDDTNAAKIIIVDAEYKFRELYGNWFHMILGIDAHASIHMKALELHQDKLSRMERRERVRFCNDRLQKRR